MIKIRCSSLPRLSICPGSLLAADGLVSADSAVAAAGTAGHAALERYFNQYGEAPIDEFIETLDPMTASRAAWYARIIGDLIDEHGGFQIIATEVAMEWEIIPNVLLTGHADLIVECKDGTDLLVDYKFNYLDVPRAAQNVQLMGYAWLHSKTKRFNDCAILALLTAGGNDDPFTAATYTPAGIAAAHTHLKKLIGLAVAEAAKRQPSDEACKYCPAHGTKRCPESVADVLAVPQVLRPYEVMPGKEDCRRLFEAIKTVESFQRKFMPMLKEAVQADPEGWAEYFEMQPTGNTRTVLDAQAAYNTLVEERALLTADQFLRLVTLPIGGLEKALKEPLKACGIPVKDHKVSVAELLGDNLELKEKSPTIKAVKK